MVTLYCDSSQSMSQSINVIAEIAMLVIKSLDFLIKF